MRLLFTALMVFAFSPAAGAAQFKFADADTAREIVLAQDAYFAKMGSAEIALRLESETADKTVDDLKAEFAAEVADWTPEGRAAIEKIIAGNAEALARIGHLLPDTVWLVQVTAKFGGGLPHTLGNAIIIHDTYNPLPPAVFFHEVFHVLSRNSAEKQPELYGLLGFKACRFEEPEGMAALHLTNPDEPLDLDYYVTLATGEGDRDFMPYLFSSTPAFDPGIKGGFPAHFGFGLLGLEVKGEACTPVMGADGEPVLKDPSEVPAYFEAIGRNTGYIIHPEETLADNFVFLMLNKQDLPNPEIPEKIGAWIDARN